MPWARLDDGIWKNRKLLRCNPASRWLYIAAIAFSRSEETGGQISREEMDFLLGGQGMKLSAVAELVSAGLLDEGEGGWSVHDYAAFNPLTEAERVRRWRHKKQGDVTADVTPDVTADVTPRVTPGAPKTKNVTPDVTPDVTPEAPNVTGDVTADVTGGVTAPSRAPAGVRWVDPSTRNPDPVIDNNSELVPLPPTPTALAARKDPSEPLVAAVHELMGQMSAFDREAVAKWPFEYPHVSAVRMVEIVRATVEKFTARGKRLRTVTYCRGQLQDEDREAREMAVNQHSRPRAYGIQSVGDLLPKLEVMR